MPLPVFMPPQPIQFADDTVIISESHPTTLKLLARILKVYEELSGLKINTNKSTFVPIATHQDRVPLIQNILDCQPSQLPLRYLGLPLTIRKPRKVDLQPMISAVQRRLEGWKANLLSYGGRVTLVKAVLSAMPLHYMQVLTIPKGVLRHIDQMRRNFLWKGNETCRGINCLVNWETVCTLAKNGGMGIIDLGIQNEALLIKWIWKLERNPNTQWAQTIQKIYGIDGAFWEDERRSFFSKDLERSLQFYQVSTELDQVNGGKVWRWTGNGQYSCASAYRALHDRGIRCPYAKLLWKMRIPTKVRIFIWLISQNSLLTQEVLISRGCNVAQGCALCTSGEIETCEHMLWECQYAESFWRGIMGEFNIRVQTMSIKPLLEIWLQIRSNLTGRKKNQWDTIWAAGAWAIWRERNKRLFTQKSKPVGMVIASTVLEINDWLQYA